MYCILTGFCTELRLPTCIKELMMMMMMMIGIATIQEAIYHLHSSCLHHLFPQQRDDVVTSRLRSAFKFPMPPVRTYKFQSFLNYRLRWYQ